MSWSRHPSSFNTEGQECFWVVWHSGFLCYFFMYMFSCFFFSGMHGPKEKAIILYWQKHGIYHKIHQQKISQHWHQGWQCEYSQIKRVHCCLSILLKSWIFNFRFFQYVSAATSEQHTEAEVSHIGGPTQLLRVLHRCHGVQGKHVNRLNSLSS